MDERCSRDLLSRVSRPSRCLCATKDTDNSSELCRCTMALSTVNAHLPAPRSQTETPRPCRRRRLSSPRFIFFLPHRGSFSSTGVNRRHEPHGQFVRHDHEGGFPSDSWPDLASTAVAFAGPTRIGIYGRKRRDSTVAAASRRRPPAESNVVLWVRDVRHRVKGYLPQVGERGGWAQQNRFRASLDWHR